MDPEQRVSHFKYMLRIDGLSGAVEDPKSIYCGVPLSNLPPDVYRFVSGEHEKLKL